MAFPFSRPPPYRLPDTLFYPESKTDDERVQNYSGQATSLGSRRVDYKVVNMMSLQRADAGRTSSSKFSLQMNPPMPCTRVAIQDITASVFTYNFPATDGNGNMATTYLEGAVVRQGTIPAGAYSADQLAAALTLSMNAVAGHLNTYSVAFDNITNKITVSTTAGATAWTLGDAVNRQFTATGNPWYSAGWQTSPAQVTPNGGGVSSLTGPDVFDGTYPSCLFFRSSLFQSQQFGQSTSDTNVTAVRMCLDEELMVVQRLDLTSNPLTYPFNGPISLVEFAVTDEFGNTVNLNGGEWQMTLLIYDDQSV